jgi:NAD(P)-dependent dehydrogenase (short-subunit alcohol dehydrogenase family)
LRLRRAVREGAAPRIRSCREREGGNHVRLNDKVAVITGAAGGQGQAAARLFAEEGARLIVTDIDGEGAEKTAEQVRDAGGEATALRTDVAREKDVAEMIRVAMDEFGTLDVLFNNAGVGYSAADRLTMASVVDTPEEDWDSILAINLKGVAMGCKHALPVMVDNGGGAIVNNASINALVGLSGADAYTAAKGGIVALTRVLAVDWGPSGVRVNCICPGGVDTAMIAPVLEDEEVLDFMRESTPLGRLARPGETARVALFLASDEASYMNGAIVPVDGGWTAR